VCPSLPETLTPYSHPSSVGLYSSGTATMHLRSGGVRWGLVGIHKRSDGLGSEESSSYIRFMRGGGRTTGKEA